MGYDGTEFWNWSKYTEKDIEEIRTKILKRNDGQETHDVPYVIDGTSYKLVNEKPWISVMNALKKYYGKYGEEDMLDEFDVEYLNDENKWVSCPDHLLLENIKPGHTSTKQDLYNSITGRGKNAVPYFRPRYRLKVGKFGFLSYD